MIRSYGLTILKGVMEIREDKIWAQFVVEVKLNVSNREFYEQVTSRPSTISLIRLKKLVLQTNQSITRINVFLSLMELLQQANIGETELPNHQSNNAMDSDVPLMDCFQNPTLQIPITLAEALQ